ncbi:MAG: LytTR family DNA-binding domain-containing protein [Gammaproteobacteria bacterium]
MTNRGPVAASARPPNVEDYLIFYLAIPAGLAFIYTTLGMRIVVGMPFLDAVTYMLLHNYASWWSTDIGTRLVRLCCRSWRPPAHVIIFLGFCATLLPMTFFYQQLSAFFDSLYPSMQQIREGYVTPGWTFAYVLDYARYAFSALPIYLLSFMGFRFFSGVDFYRYGLTAADQPESVPTAAGFLQTAAVADGPAYFLRNSDIPIDADIIALKAEEHYIQVWSTSGAGLVRYRFQDAVQDLEGRHGMQVHRSWWVNLEHISSWHRKGRSIELVMDNKQHIPVSQAHTQSIQRALERLDRNDFAAV